MRRESSLVGIICCSRVGGCRGGGRDDRGDDNNEGRGTEAGSSLGGQEAVGGDACGLVVGGTTWQLVGS